VIGLKFGVHVVDSGLLRVYVDGAYQSTWSYPVKSGAYVGLAAHQATASVDRFEAREGPGGPLVWADDFATLGGWSDALNAAGWSAVAGRAVHNASHNSTSSVLVRPRLTATYFEAIGVDFAGGVTSDRWVMIDAYRGAVGRDDDPLDEPHKGYRVLVRDNDPYPHYTVVNGTPVAEAPTAGWTVGLLA
jgi:hypothetical protein